MKHELLLLLILSACGGTEATEVALETTVDPQTAAVVTTNLGYSVEILEARTALANIEFTTEGEEHENLTARVWSWLVPSAHAHPGHSAGGIVTGELRGDFVVDWVDDTQPLGTARLLTGQYEGANFAFRTASADDGLAADDPMLGHVAHLLLAITRDDAQWQADIRIDVDAETFVIGAPFQHEVVETSTETLVLGLLTTDPTTDDTLFDDLDFAALDDDDDGAIAIVPGETTHNQLRRRLTSHAFYGVEAR